MFTTKDLKEKTRLDKDEILKVISEEDIFRKYIDYDFRLGELFLSPLRREKHPSFNIYRNRHGKVVYKDFSDTGGNAIYFVMNRFNLDFYNALKKIVNDFQLDTLKIEDKGIQEQSITEIESEEKVKFFVTEKPFTEEELKYWKQYGITKEILNSYNVVSVLKLFKNEYLYWTTSESQPIFAYKFPRTGNIKIYRPFGNKFSKWRTNANNDWDIQGYDQLPIKGKLIIFTKSMKDVMTLNSLGYSAVATHAEGNYINPDFVRHTSGRFDNLISLYDRDKTGMKGAKYLWKSFKIKPYFLPKWANCKDISDYHQIYGKEETLNLIKNEFRF